MTEGKRFSPCWRRSSDVPLVVEHFPSLIACIPTPVYPFSPTGALSKKAFHKETGEALWRVPPQRQLAACGVKDDQPTLGDDATPAVSVCIADVPSSTLIFRHLPLPVCLLPSSSTRPSLPSHLVIELRIKAIHKLRCLSSLPEKRKPLHKQLAACRVKEDHPTLCDDAAATVFGWPYGRASRDCQGFPPFVSRWVCVRACDNHVPCVLVTC